MGFLVSEYSDTILVMMDSIKVIFKILVILKTIFELMVNYRKKQENDDSDR